MPLRLAWSSAKHLADAPRVFTVLWVVSSLALVVVAALCLVKACKMCVQAYRHREARGNVFLPRLLEAEIALALTPFFFAWVGWASVLDMQTAGVLKFLINIVTAVMLRNTSDLLLAALGEEPGVRELMKTAEPQAWWRTPPCCCIAGVCVTGEAEPLRPRYLRFGKYMVDFFVAVNLVDALSEIVGFSRVASVERVGAWCVAELPAQGAIQRAIANTQGLSSPFAMYAVSILAKGAAACYGPEDPLHLSQKGNMAGTISLFTGLGPVIAGAFAKGYPSPVLGPDDTLIRGAVGCPVYDKEVMTQMWFAACLPVLMLPFAWQLEGMLQADDAARAKSLRIERAGPLLAAEEKEGQA